jgi:two-component system nitrogen regulation response regulator NtrX
MTGRILVVDDEQNIRRMLRAVLEEQEYEVGDVGGGSEACVACESFDPDVVLLDLVMPPGPDGIETLALLKERCPELVVIMMSGKASLHDAVRATQLGAFQFLEKPLTPESMLVAVKAGIDLCKVRAENRALRAQLDDPHTIVGTSKGIEAVRALVTQVAPTPVRVLISGESGTGKELVARAIHRQSPRSERPLICVNSAAIPRELVESEMFGHERGAFTGASEPRRGRFELADGGTLFLDEVGELDPDVQAKLLRVLETGVIERVGGEAGRNVDVRVVAATNKDLESEVKSGGFREDLFYRLNVFPIHVPPLRDRVADIPELASHLATVSGTRCGRPAVTFAKDGLERLKTHSWPGNVRELANVIERLTIVCRKEVVDSTDVDAVLGGAGPGGGPSSARGSATGVLADDLDAYETILIEKAIADAGGNIADAARRLKTDRANLYRRMRRLGIGQKDTSVSK